jgi:predicted nucleotidyltransferase
MTLDGDPYLDRIKDIVLDALAGYSVTVYLFGSRARGTASERRGHCRGGT